MSRFEQKRGEQRARLAAGNRDRAFGRAQLHRTEEPALHVRRPPRGYSAPPPHVGEHQCVTARNLSVIYRSTCRNTIGVRRSLLPSVCRPTRRKGSRELGPPRHTITAAGSEAAGGD